MTGQFCNEIRRKGSGVRGSSFFFWLVAGRQGKPCYAAEVSTMGEEGHLDLDFQPGSYVGRQLTVLSGVKG